MVQTLCDRLAGVSAGTMRASLAYSSSQSQYSAIYGSCDESCEGGGCDGTGCDAGEGGCDSFGGD